MVARLGLAGGVMLAQSAALGSPSLAESQLSREDVCPAYTSPAFMTCRVLRSQKRGGSRFRLGSPRQQSRARRALAAGRSGRGLLRLGTVRSSPTVKERRVPVGIVTSTSKNQSTNRKRGSDFGAAHRNERLRSPGKLQAITSRSSASHVLRVSLC